VRRLVSVLWLRFIAAVFLAASIVVEIQGGR